MSDSDESYDSHRNMDDDEDEQSTGFGSEPYDADGDLDNFDSDLNIESGDEPDPLDNIRRLIREISSEIIAPFEKEAFSSIPDPVTTLQCPTPEELKEVADDLDFSHLSAAIATILTEVEAVDETALHFSSQAMLGDLTNPGDDSYHDNKRESKKAARLAREYSDEASKVASEVDELVTELEQLELDIVHKLKGFFWCRWFLNIIATTAASSNGCHPLFRGVKHSTGKVLTKGFLFELFVKNFFSSLAEKYSFVGGAGDEGIDFEIKNPQGNLIAVGQAKNWKKFGPEVIRGFAGAMLAKGMTRGLLFFSFAETTTSCREAVEAFAEVNHLIELIGVRSILRKIMSVGGIDPCQIVQVGDDHAIKDNVEDWAEGAQQKLEKLIDDLKKVSELLNNVSD